MENPEVYETHWDPQAKLFYRYDPDWRSWVYLHPKTGAPWRQCEDHEQAAVDKFSTSLEKRKQRLSTGSVEEDELESNVASSASAIEHDEAGDDDYSASVEHLDSTFNRLSVGSRGTHACYSKWIDLADGQLEYEYASASYPPRTSVEGSSSGQVAEEGSRHQKYFGPIDKGILLGPAELITDQELLEGGQQARMRVLPTEEDTDLLHPDFKVQPNPKAFFKLGRVIKVLWPELAGCNIDKMTAGTTPDPRFKYENIYSKIRWFVVIKEGDQWCTCLYSYQDACKYCIWLTNRRPISTYGGRGLTKKGLVKSQHSIIYTGKEEPAPLSREKCRSRELGMQLAIRVEPNSRQHKMDPKSRLHYCKLYTIEHNVKVYDFGMVHHGYLSTLWKQWHDLTFERPKEVIQAASFVDYAVVTNFFRPDSMGRSRGQISIDKDDRLGVISSPKPSAWIKVWNENSGETGYVWSAYVLLDSEG